MWREDKFEAGGFAGIADELLRLEDEAEKFSELVRRDSRRYARNFTDTKGDLK